MDMSYKRKFTFKRSNTLFKNKKLIASNEEMDHATIGILINTNFLFLISKLIFVRDYLINVIYLNHIG